MPQPLPVLTGLFGKTSKYMAPNDQNSIMMMLGEIKGDIKAIHDKLDDSIKKTNEVDSRVTLLEHWKTGLMGKLSIITIVITGAWALIIKKI